MLVVASGLFLRSLVKLVTMDIGFDRNNVLIVNTDLHTAKIAPELQAAMFEEIESRLRSLPGVLSAGRSIITPVSNRIWNNELEVDRPNPPTGEDAVAYLNFISPGYLETLRTPLLAGRSFGEADTKTSAKVAIVNEALARRFFANSNPVGKYFRVKAEPGKEAVPIQIVGLVKNSKYESLREESSVTAYFPITQIPEHAEEQSFELRTAMRPSVLVPAVQEAVASVSKTIPLDFTTLAQQVDDSLVQERLLATLSTFFGGLALLLAMIGLYGALSYLVTQRQGEFGIRMALGAPRGAILRLVMRDVVIVLAGGLTAGTCLAFATWLFCKRCCLGLHLATLLHSSRPLDCSPPSQLSQVISQRAGPRASIRWWPCGTNSSQFKKKRRKCPVDANTLCAPHSFKFHPRAECLCRLTRGRREGLLRCRRR